MITVDDITYSEPAIESQATIWQDILYKGSIVGALQQTQHSILLPIAESYQFSIHRDQLPADISFVWGESEDIDCITVYTETIEDFIIAYNACIYGRKDALQPDQLRFSFAE